MTVKVVEYGTRPLGTNSADALPSQRHSPSSLGARVAKGWAASSARWASTCSRLFTGRLKVTVGRTSVITAPLGRAATTFSSPAPGSPSWATPRSGTCGRGDSCSAGFGLGVVTFSVGTSLGFSRQVQSVSTSAATATASRRNVDMSASPSANRRTGFLPRGAPGNSGEVGPLREACLPAYDVASAARRCRTPPMNAPASPPPWRPRVSTTTVTPQLQRAAAAVEGRWPEWLQGTLMRTAPAVFDVAGWRAQHWFDGLGMMFSFTVSPRGVGFAQRLLETVASRAAGRGRLDVSSFASPNQRGFFRRLVEPIPRTTDNTNVNALKVGGEWVAYTETDHQLRVDGESLASKGEVPYADGLPRRLTMTAHPHWDAEANRVLNVGSTLGREVTVYAFDHAPGSWSRRVFGRYRSRELSYMHSFGLTPKEAIVIAHPWVLKPLSLLWSNKGFGEHFSWHPERGSKLLVFDRSKTDAAPEVFETDTLYVFHCANAFRDGADRVLDVLSYPDPAIISELKVEPLSRAQKAVRPALKRLRVKPGGATSVETLREHCFELPAIAYRAFNGKPYRFLYGSTLAGDGADLCKLDLETGAQQTFGEAGVVFGEPVFVARPGAEREDDGVVLTVGSTPERAQLAVLDAASFEPLARARVELPIPLGFHGSFVAG